MGKVSPFPKKILEQTVLNTNITILEI